MPKVTLNGKDYFVTNIVNADALKRTAVPDDGQPKPFKITSADIAATGIGWAKSRRINDQGIGGLNDANADTRHPVAVTLPHLANSVANPAEDSTNGTADHGELNAWVNFAGELVGAFQDVGGADPYEDVRSRLFQAASDTWTVGVNIYGDTGGQTDGIAALDMAVHKGSLYTLIAHENGVSSSTIEAAEYRLLSQTTVGGAWSSTAVQPGGSTLWITRAVLVTIPVNSGYPLGLVLDGATSTRHDIIVAIEEDAAASGGSIDQTRIYSSPDAGASSFPALANVPGKPRGKGIWRDPFASGFPRAPVISTTMNLFFIDVANGQAVPLLSDSILGGGDGDGFMQVGIDDAVYLSTSNGDILRVELGNEIGAIKPPQNIGPMTHVPGGGAGILAAKQGPVTAMATSDRFLYIAFKGASKSHILCWNYENHTWHSFYERGDTNTIYRMAFSNADDGTQRLHIAESGHTMLQFEHPDSSLFQVTSGTALTGLIQIAEDDFGDANITTGAISATVRADDLSASTSNEYMTLKRGSDGAAWTTTTVGNFLSGTKTLQYEANSRGIGVSTLRNEISFFRDGGTATDTPALIEFEVLARNKLNTLNAWRVTVDLEQSARLQGNTTTEGVITNLETVRDSGALVPFLIGEASEFEVDLSEYQLATNLVERGGGDGRQLGRRTGTASFVLKEAQ
jgi:hypothetical protein